MVQSAFREIVLIVLSMTVSGKKAKVRFDFEARESDELTLKLDDIVDVLGEVEPGWWEGQLGNKIGEFPSNFVEIIDENDVGQGNNTPAETQGKYFTFISYNARKPLEGTTMPSSFFGTVFVTLPGLGVQLSQSVWSLIQIQRFPVY